MNKLSERIKEIRERKDAISTEIDTADEERAKELRDEAAALNKEFEDISVRVETMSELAQPVTVPVIEDRSADDFARTGHTVIETRQLLGTGNIAKPAKVGGVAGLGEVGNSIVDDVHAFALTGTGSWIAAYKATEAAAAAVTDGSNVAGTASTYNYVTINPAEWGVLDEISKQVAKLSPLDYKGAIEQAAVNALRTFAAGKITAAIIASSLATTKNSVALDATYIRKIVLGFRSIEGKGATCLYLNQTDLATLGGVRGTNEKKPVFEITFDAGTTTSGVIKDGGMAVRFRVIDGLTTGTQLYGQPGAVDMPMWDNYSVETDEGGDYFKRNMIGIRGLQTANADLVAKGGMHIIKQAAA